MANVLSQEEIDALLGGLTSGQIDTSGAEAGGVAKPSSAVAFDFTDQNWVTRGRLPTLEIIHDRFARLLRLSLSTTLRRSVEIQVCSQWMYNFADFGRSLEKPSSLHPLKLEPLSGLGLLALPARMVLTLVDLLFGGDGRPTPVNEDRDFTLIETRVINKIAEEVCRCYAESWGPVYPISVVTAGHETNVQFINIAQPSDPINVMDFDISIDGIHSSISICLPYSTIEPIKETLKGTFIAENQGQQNVWGERIRDNLFQSKVNVRATLGSATITGRDLLQLKKGDIIQLNEDYEHPVEIMVEGVRKFWGAVGAYKSGRALQVTGLAEK